VTADRSDDDWGTGTDAWGEDSDDGWGDVSDSDERPAEEVVELLESLEGAEDGDVAGSNSNSDDDEYDTDPRSERFGLYAGGVVTLLLTGLLFVGPWRWFDVDFSADPIPFVFRESTQGNVLAIGAVAIALVGLLAGVAYRASTRDTPEDYQWGIAMNVVVVQMLAALAAFVLGMLVPVGGALLSGEFVSAVILVVMAVVYLIFFTLFEVIGITLYVGIPALIGVYAGSLIGSVISTAPPEDAR
jgi:hypothetical protein